MSRKLLSGRALFVVPGLAAAAAGLILELTSSWQLARIGWLDHELSFEDMWQVTATADCVASDPHWSPQNATCDPWGRPYNYPLVWARIFAKLGLGSTDTQRLGFVVIVLFGLTICALAFLTIRRAPVGAVITLTLSAVSPPALMAMERGNIDLLVWPFVVLALWLMSSGRWASTVLVLAIAVYLKIFPLGAVAGALARRRDRFLFVSAAAVVCVGVLSIEGEELPFIRRATPQVPFHSWGVSVIPSAAFGSHESVPVYAIGLILLGLCFAVALLALRVSGGRVPAALETMRQSVTTDHVSEIVVNSGLGLVLFTYALGTNFDYRMLVLTVLVAGLCRCWANVFCRRLAFALITLQYVAYPFVFPWELIGDFLWFAIAPGLAVLACWMWIPGVRKWISAVDDDGTSTATPLTMQA